MAASELKVLFLRGMPADLVREVKAVAARRGQTLTSIVAEALARSLAVTGTTTAPADELRADMAWYRAHQTDLARRYQGQYVAIIDERVVDHAARFDDLARRVFARYGNRPIFMPRVQLGEREVRVRSPRRSKS